MGINSKIIRNQRTKLEEEIKSIPTDTKDFLLLIKLKKLTREIESINRKYDNGN
jgi:hypothetical protein